MSTEGTSMHETHSRISEPQLEKRQALIDLLALPDSPDLRRGHHVTIEGRSDRHRIVPHLAAMFIQQHMVEMEERVISVFDRP